MIKSLLNNILPPLIIKIWKLLIQTFKKESLFDGDSQLFVDSIINAKVYGEYGCGESTIYVVNNYNCEVMSVDSSKEWKNNVLKKCKDKSKLKLHYSDIGTIGAWGYPINYNKSENFSDYTDWLWQQDAQPDVVLIDGRFRVCCFLTSLLNAKPGTKIIFDDYQREEYHFVERFIQPVNVNKRQALFIIKEMTKPNIDEIKSAINQFRYVTN